jgi:hypothetical protein
MSRFAGAVTLRMTADEDDAVIGPVVDLRFRTLLCVRGWFGCGARLQSRIGSLCQRRSTKTQRQQQTIDEYSAHQRAPTKRVVQMLGKHDVPFSASVW